MNQVFIVEIPAYLLLEAFRFAEGGVETGGFLVVSIKRESGKVVYRVEKIKERAMERTVASATINSGGPHLWHTHPKRFGARMSAIDERSLVAVWGLQAISLYGTPPLFLVFGIVDKPDGVVLTYNMRRRLACLHANSYLEFRAYIAVPSSKSVSVVSLGKRCFEWRKVDGNECLLIQDGPSFKPVSPELLITLVREQSLRYPGSVLSLLSVIKGVCSRGPAPDPVDIMRLVSLKNTMARLGVAPRHFVVIKENGFSYRVTLGDPVYPEILEPEVRVIEDEGLG